MGSAVAATCIQCRQHLSLGQMHAQCARIRTVSCHFTSSAPRRRSGSACRPRAVTSTRAPACFENCTAKLPMVNAQCGRQRQRKRVLHQPAQRVLPEWDVSPAPVHAIIESRLIPSRVRLFIVFMQASLKD